MIALVSTSAYPYERMGALSLNPSSEVLTCLVQQNLSQTGAMSAGSPPSLQNASLISLRQLMKEPFAVASGLTWSFFWVISAIFFRSSVHQMAAVMAENPMQPGFATRFLSTTKQLFINSLSLTASSCYVLKWAHESRLVALGRAFSVLSPLNMGCYLVTCSVGIVDSTRECLAELRVLAEPDNNLDFVHSGNSVLLNMQRHGHLKARERSWHVHNAICAGLGLMSNVSSVVWAAFGLLGLLTGGVFSPTLIIVATGASCLLFAAWIAYCIALYAMEQKQWVVAPQVIQGQLFATQMGAL